MTGLQEANQTDAFISRQRLELPQQPALGQLQTAHCWPYCIEATSAIDPRYGSYARGLSVFAVIVALAQSATAAASQLCTCSLCPAQQQAFATEVVPGFHVFRPSQQSCFATQHCCLQSTGCVA